jgi:hypothetical protein
LAIALTSSIATAETKQLQFEFRTWTDTSGRTAVAVFVEFKNDRAILRRENGQLAQVSIEQLSASDRAYLEQRREALFEESQAPMSGLVAGLSRGIREASSLVSGRWITSFSNTLVPERKTAQAEEEIRPARLALVKVSRRLLADHAERDVNKQEYIRDVIVSLPIQGPAITRGTTTVQLVPSANYGVVDILLHGVCDTDTAGSTRGVTIQSHATTRFAARKRLFLSAAGLQAMPAASSASTQTETTGIDTSYPRLRGRIATRIASNRVNETRGQANWESARHAEQRINAALDQEVETLLSNVRPQLQQTVAELTAIQRDTGYRLRYSTTPLHLLVSVEDPHGNPEAALPVLDDDRPVAIQVHRSLLTQAVTDVRLRNLASKWMARSGGRGLLVSARPSDLRMHTRWSADGNWLTVHWSSDEPVDRLARQ